MTIPGMLITGGVLLLIIAFIIFLATAKKKDKKPKKDKTAEIGGNTATQVNQSATNQVPQNEMVSAPALSSENNIEAIPEVTDKDGVAMPNNLNDLPPVMPAAVPNVDPNGGIPEVAPANNESIVPPVAEDIKTAFANPNPIKPTVGINPIAPENNLTETPAMAPTPSPVPVVPETPSVPVAESNLNMNTTSSIPDVSTNNSGVVYGGANPTVPNVNIADNTSHQIYGGANPLENTQTLNVVNNDNSSTKIDTPLSTPESTPVKSVAEPSIPGANIVPPVDNSQVITPESIAPNNTSNQSTGIPAEQVEATAPSTSVEVLNI